MKPQGALPQAIRARAEHTRERAADIRARAEDRGSLDNRRDAGAEALNVLLIDFIFYGKNSERFDLLLASLGS